MTPKEAPPKAIGVQTHFITQLGSVTCMNMEVYTMTLGVVRLAFWGPKQIITKKSYFFAILAF